jgi:hypothetical protein
VATNPYLPKQGSNPYLPSSSKKKQQSILGRIVGGPVGFVGNLAGDVKDAVVGLPAGVVMTVKDPVGSGKLVGQQVWQTWSPLFKGHPEEFAANFYDHPLAPILDVASVFTLGAGSAARGAGALSKAGIGGPRVAKVAGLRTSREIELLDPTSKGRHPVYKQLSNRAGRRIVQEGIMSLEAHLPKWGGQGKKLGDALARGRYESRFLIDMSHRAAAKNLMLTTMLKAGEALSDDHPGAANTRSQLMAGAYMNLLRHNRHLTLTPEEAAKRGVGKRGSHYAYVIAPDHFDRASENSLHRLRKREAKLDTQRASNAELANDLPKYRAELADVNDQLSKMHREGWTITTPASANRRSTPGQHMEQEARDLMEVQRRSLELERLVEQAENAKVKHDAAVAELADLKAQRMDVERRGFTEKFSAYSGTAEEFEKAAERFGRIATVRDVRRAARTQDGKVYVVPKHDATNLGIEMASSSRFMRMVWDKPTYLWKMAMIGYTPRSITNNAVGNWAMYALREGGGVDGVKALYDAVRLTKGDSAALLSMKAATPFKRNNWLYRYFGTELGNVFGHELLTDGARAKSKLKKRASEGLYPLVHKIADEPVRIASISKFLRESPEVRALMKDGLDLDDAIHRALRKNPSLQRRASEHARVVAGDYFTLRNWEKTMRKLIPFYLWDRHIVRTTGNMFADTPGRLVVMQQLSNAGIEETEAILGEIPDFLKGAIPLEMLGLDSEEGRNSILTTASLNPWATVGEIVNLGQALSVGGNRPSDALIGVHPFITGGIEFVTGRSVLSGAPKPTDGGLVFSVAKNAVMGFPGLQLADELMSEDTDTTETGNPLLFNRNEKTAISRFLGVPIRGTDPAVAARMKAAQNAGKEPKTKNPYMGGGS